MVAGNLLKDIYMERIGSARGPVTLAVFKTADRYL